MNSYPVRQLVWPIVLQTIERGSKPLQDTKQWSVFYTAVCKTVALICVVAAVRFDSFTLHQFNAVVVDW